jgi:hypothetical protein
MSNARKMLISFAMLAAAFAGGACAQWLLAVNGAAYAAKAPAARSTPAEIRSQAFLLVDANGKLIARLGSTPEGPALILRDRKSVDIIALGFWHGGVGLGLNSEPGTARANLGVSLDGQNAGLEIIDRRGNRTVLISTAPN